MSNSSEPIVDQPAHEGETQLDETVNQHCEEQSEQSGALTSQGEKPQSQGEKPQSQGEKPQSQGVEQTNQSDGETEESVQYIRSQLKAVNKRISSRRATVGVLNVQLNAIREQQRKVTAEKKGYVEELKQAKRQRVLLRKKLRKRD